MWEPDTPPPPWWRRAFAHRSRVYPTSAANKWPNSEKSEFGCFAGSLRPRSLGRRGEGVTLAASTTVVLVPRGTPSLGFPKLASSLRKTALPHQGTHQGGGGRGVFPIAVRRGSVRESL